MKNMIFSTEFFLNIDFCLRVHSVQNMGKVSFYFSDRNKII